MWGLGEVGEPASTLAFCAPAHPLAAFAAPWPSERKPLEVGKAVGSVLSARLTGSCWASAVLTAALLSAARLLPRPPLRIFLEVSSD